MKRVSIVVFRRTLAVSIASKIDLIWLYKLFCRCFGHAVNMLLVKKFGTFAMLPLENDLQRHLLVFRYGLII